MTILDKLYELKKELYVLGLTLTKDFPPYFCTPLDAIVFAHIGTDGIHYCIAKSEKEIENSPVYVVSPTMPEHYVELVARNLIDFLSLIIACKDASALEYISYASEDSFNEFLTAINNQIHENQDYNREVKEAIITLKTAFELQNIDNVYHHVNESKGKSIYHAKLTFTNEYYNEIV